MTAGQIWRRDDGMVWVEVQAETIEPSGWRLLVPLFDPADAPEAPPLVVTADRWRARVHLVRSAPSDELGQPHEEMNPEDVAALRSAVRALVEP